MKQQQDFEFSTRGFVDSLFESAAIDAGYITDIRAHPQNFGHLNVSGSTDVTNTSFDTTTMLTYSKSQDSLVVQNHTTFVANFVIHDAVKLTFGEKPSVKLLIEDIDEAAKRFWNATARVVGQPLPFPDLE